MAYDQMIWEGMFVTVFGSHKYTGRGDVERGDVGRGDHSKKPGR